MVFLSDKRSGYHILCFSVFSVQLLLFPAKLVGLSLLRFLGFILWIYILGEETQTGYSYKTLFLRKANSNIRIPIGRSYHHAYI